MNPLLARTLMVLAGVACLIATRFAPDQHELLLTSGAGLIGWAMKAPGHDGPRPPSPPAVPTLPALCFLLGCSSNMPPPCDAATYDAIMAECQVAVRTECPEGLAQCAARDACIAKLKDREATCLAR